MSLQSENELKSQVDVNKNDITWMKESLKRLSSHMDKQTGFLVGIIVEIFLGIIALIVIAL